jgi:transcriptional regulator with XRE-family HTH domain
LGSGTSEPRHHHDMARMASRPKQVDVWYRGIPYVLDLVRCRRALVQRQIDGELDSMEGLARAVGISRSTASRFFSGRPTSLAVTLKILDALHLTFEEVATLAIEDLPTMESREDDPDGMAGAGVPTRPGPQGRPDGMAARSGQRIA